MTTLVSPSIGLDLASERDSYSSLSQRPLFVPRGPVGRETDDVLATVGNRRSPVTFGLASVASLNSICPPKCHAVGATMASLCASSSPTVRLGGPRPATQLRRGTSRKQPGIRCILSIGNNCSENKEFLDEVRTKIRMAH